MPKIHLKPAIFDFKVVQGYRCWYPRKARQQCSKCVYLQPFSR